MTKKKKVEPYNQFIKAHVALLYRSHRDMTLVYHVIIYTGFKVDSVILRRCSVLKEKSSLCAKKSIL